MASVTYQHTEHLYPGADAPAVNDFSLEVADGEFIVLVGPSGSGKSTCLRMLAGLEEVTSGKIFIGKSDVTHAPPKDRDIAMVFQNYALYPHMSVGENMEFALKMAGVRSTERNRRVHEAAKLLDLTEYLDRKPRALSGGQRQRVAMGRAIVRQPQVFCMDEPLSNLDAKLRVSTRTQIAALQHRLGITTVYVTHDQVEAMTMGDRVVVLDDGVLQQADTPLALYDRPANVFVAGFIGSPAMNLMSATLTEAGVRIGRSTMPVERSLAASARGPITVGVRPEAWRVVGPGEGLPVTVNVVEELGSDAFIYGSSDVEGTPEHITIRVDGRRKQVPGDVVHVQTDPTSVHLFDATSGAALH
ncbi:sn-glycerol-3-phosphate ABC transporter ATP-binding protein UgpC [Nocardioides sp. YIM 152315]|uniref:ABC transporter ATP-binding protein n=1 Tax=Nocardioides sp. YIM 152315 TaxID=3031760 RepID=UPI0023DBB00D|nr:sn-glycerol-3-phosphate ABC transporter ATP-binding protein UgpC [Nocardioides sp. YIM 152315]MDF1603209.1 sn-glycerol-3-phosphate ABC transporter ATP-binding protein UgpC [Nocardioides sp. YIM 152315]